MNRTPFIDYKNVLSLFLPDGLLDYYHQRHDFVTIYTRKYTHNSP